MNTLSYSDAKQTTPNFSQLIEQAPVLSPTIQGKIILQWFDDIENELQWQKTLEQPQPKLEQLALVALQQSHQGKKVEYDKLLKSL